MKYLFINTVAGFGSTGRIVAETCRELMAQGHECRIAYGRNENLCPDIPSYRISNTLDNLCNVALTRALDLHAFGTRSATRRFLRWVKAYDPDVIWLHNLHGYYLHAGLLFDYLRTSGKEIRWFLHDCWAFTGHCPHFDFVGCERWKTGCHHCPQKDMYPQTLLLDGSARNYRLKKEAFTGIPSLTVETPSNWMANLIRQSFLGEYPVEVHYNTVDPAVFHPTPSDFAARHGLEGKKIVLGVSNVWYDRKGLPDFVALSGLLPEDYQIVLIGLQEAQIRLLPKEILGLPRTANAKELAQAYTAAYVYVSPSVEESFGMTVLEAISCGTPAIVYQGTACQEIAEQYGSVAVPRGAEHLCNAIVQMEGAKK